MNKQQGPAAKRYTGFPLSSSRPTTQGAVGHFGVDKSTLSAIARYEEGIPASMTKQEFIEARVAPAGSAPREFRINADEYRKKITREIVPKFYRDGTPMMANNAGEVFHAPSAKVDPGDIKNFSQPGIYEEMLKEIAPSQWESVKAGPDVNRAIRTDGGRRPKSKSAMKFTDPNFARQFGLMTNEEMAAKFGYEPGFSPEETAKKKASKARVAAANTWESPTGSRTFDDLRKWEELSKSRWGGAHMTPRKRE